MIDADIKGKLASNYSRAHDRSEDLLTSTVFGLLRYIPHKSGLLPILECSRRAAYNEQMSEPVSLSAKKMSLPILDAYLEFWPSLAEHGEPDILVEWRDGDGSTRDAALVEVKLHSPKSGEAASGEGYMDEVPDPDQLVKYWQGLKKRFPDPVSKTLIYLTSHSTPPIDELAQSLKRASDMKLAWLSWRDVSRALGPCTALPAMDIKRLLAHRGFKPFSGFEIDPIAIPVKGFWKSAGWFDGAATPWPNSGFWRNT